MMSKPSRRDVIKALAGAALVGTGAAGYELSGRSGRSDASVHPGSPRRGAEGMSRPSDPVPLGMAGPRWVLKFSDEFSGGRLDGNIWRDDAAGVVDDGRLVLTRAGSVTTEDSYRFDTGAVEIRARLPRSTSGSTGRFWIRPVRGSPPIAPLVVGTPQAVSTARKDAPGFHVFGAQVRLGSVSWYFDGRPAGAYRGAAADPVSQGPWHLVLTLEVEDLHHPAPFVVDYVRAWQE
jgi:hypothetical protein